MTAFARVGRHRMQQLNAFRWALARPFAFPISRTQRIRSDYSIPKASLRSAKATTAKLVSQDISHYRCIGAETLILEYASRLAVFVAPQSRRRCHCRHDNSTTVHGRTTAPRCDHPRAHRRQKRARHCPGSRLLDCRGEQGARSLRGGDDQRQGPHPRAGA